MAVCFPSYIRFLVFLTRPTVHTHVVVDSSDEKLNEIYVFSQERQLFHGLNAHRHLAFLLDGTVR